ncbi:MAG: thioredoxin domain-containing protein [Anaerolineales bacterium]|nr:thioredoxin domain-containing protein [Anaerolineales bacterium]
MAKRTKQKRQAANRETNWLLIGGIIAVGVIVLFALLFLSLQGPEKITLLGYCEDNPDRCVTRGNKDSDVVVVEVSDYGCSHCRDFHAETLPLLKQQYIDTDEIYWVVMPYALSATTLPASNAAMCANEQGAFFEYSDALFEQQSNATLALTRAGFEQAAESLGLDMDAFSQCLSDGRYNSVVSENADTARSAGVSATPTFFLNDDMLEGAYPFAIFQQRLDALLN